MGRARECDANTLTQYRAKMEKLARRRASLVRKLDSTAEDIARAAFICERAMCDHCRGPTDLEQDLVSAEMLAEKAKKRCVVLQKRLEIIVDEYQWISRRYAELGQVERPRNTTISDEE